MNLDHQPGRGTETTLFEESTNTLTRLILKSLVQGDPSGSIWTSASGLSLMIVCFASYPVFPTK